MTTTWYQCNVCQILLQNLHQFIVHKSQHDTTDDVGGEGTVPAQRCYQLLHAVSGGLVTLEGLSEPTSLELFHPKVELNPVERSYEEFITEIHSPSVLVESIEIETEPLPYPSSLGPLSETARGTRNINSIRRNARITPEGRQVIRINGQTRTYAHCERCGHLMRTDTLKRHLLSCNGLVTSSRLRHYSTSRRAQFPEHKSKRKTHLRLTNHNLANKINSGHQVGSEAGGLDTKVSVASSPSLISPVRTTPGRKPTFRKRKRRNYFRSRVRHHKECPTCGGSVLDSNFSRHRRACALQMKLTGRPRRLLHYRSPGFKRADISTPAAEKNMECDMEEVDKQVPPKTGRIRNHGIRTRTRDIPADNADPPHESLKQNVTLTIGSRKLIRKRGPNGRRYIMSHCGHCRRLMRLDVLKRHELSCQGNQGVKPLELSSGGPTSSRECEDAQPTTATLSDSNISSHLETGDRLTVQVATDPPKTTLHSSTNKPRRRRAGDHVLYRRRRKGNTSRPRVYKMCPSCGIYMLNTNLARHLKSCLRIEKRIPLPRPAGTGSETKLKNLHSVDDFQPTRKSPRPLRVMKETNLPSTQLHPAPILTPSLTQKVEAPTAAETTEDNTKFRQRSNCPICGRVQLAANLSKHLEVCDGTVDYTLEIAEDGAMGLPPTNSTRTSETKGKPEKMLSCPSCGRVVRVGNMARHRKLCEDTRTRRPWRCTEFGCPATFSTPAALEVHTQIYHTGVKKHKCRRCKKPFATELSLQNHTKRGHCQLREGNPKLEQVEPMELFPAATKVVEENDTVERCEANSSRTTFVDENRPHKSSKPRKRRNRSTRTQCSNCGRIQLLGNLKRHQAGCEKRKSKKPWTCTHFGCAISLRTFGALERHVKIYHTGELPYECEYCHKRYATTGSIAQHFKICRHKRQREEELEVEETEDTANIGQEGENVSDIANRYPGLEFQKITFEDQCAGGELPDPPICRDGRIQRLTTCENCGHVLLEADMARHVKTCKKQGESKHHWRCNQAGCGATFSVYAALQYHLRTHHPGKREHRCEECGNLFATNKSLRTHRNRFRYRTCLKPQKPEIGISALTARDKTSEELEQPPPIPVSFFTGSTTKSKVGQKDPEKVPVVSESIYQCEGCGKGFDTQQRVRRHFLRFCKYKFDGGDAAGYECNLCHKTFPTTHSRSEHIRRTCWPNRVNQNPRRKTRVEPQPASSVSDDIEWVLENGETFILVGEGTKEGNDKWEVGAKKRSTNSTNPLNIPTEFRNEKGKRQVECHKCGRLVSAKNLKHVRQCKGADGPPWRCTYFTCPSIFTKESSRDVHVRIYHHTERDFTCDKCGRKYPTPQALKRHMNRICSKNKNPVTEGPMRCGYCPTQFSNQESLMLHFKTCSGNAETSAHSLESCSTPSVEDDKCYTAEAEVPDISRPVSRTVVKVEEDFMVQENIVSSHTAGNSRVSYANRVPGMDADLEDYMDSRGDVEFQIIVPDILDSDGE